MNLFDADKTRMIAYRMLKKKQLSQYVNPFSSNTGTSRTDGQTDRQTDGRTDRIAISISRVSVLTRDKNRCGYNSATYCPISMKFCTGKQNSMAIEIA